MIENDKAQWKNGIISCIIVTFGSLIIMSIMNTFTFEGWIFIQPFLWLLVFFPVLIIELISRIKKRGRNAQERKLA